MNPIRAVALVGDHLRHRWYATRLADDRRIELRGVVSERQPPEISGPRDADDALVREHFELRRQAEERWLGSARAWDALGVPVLTVARGDTNTSAVAEWVRAREPEFLLLYGCGIVRAPLLEWYEGRVVNVHLGLSPYYRGHATNFWPLVKGEPECVGATVHLATADVDAGDILTQVRPEISREDGSHDIGCKAIIAGTEALLDVLPGYARGAVRTVRPRPGGEVYRRTDFDADPDGAIVELRRRFSAGMISDYLANKRERDARFPIVE